MEIGIAISVFLWSEGGGVDADAVSEGELMGVGVGVVYYIIYYMHVCQCVLCWV